MSYSYPIWVEVQACIYQSSRSYGARDINYEKVCVGTSSKYSNEFVTRAVKKKDLGDKLRFRAYHNGLFVSEMIIDKNTKEVISRRDAEIKELDYEGDSDSKFL